MLLSCPVWGWDCSCLKERPDRGRKASKQQLYLGIFCLNFHFIEKSCPPRGKPWPRSYWHSQVRCKDWGQLWKERNPPKTPHCDRGPHSQYWVNGGFPPAPLLIDSCQSPLTAAQGSAQSVSASWVMPTLGGPPGRGQRHCCCSRPSIHWWHVPGLGHAVAKHSSREGPSHARGGLAAGAKGSCAEGQCAHPQHPPGPPLSPPWGFPKDSPCSHPFSMEESQLFPLLGVMQREGEGVTTEKQCHHHTPAAPRGTPSSQCHRDRVSPGRRRMFSVSPSTSTPQGCTQSVTKQGRAVFALVSVLPSHPATVPAGLKGAGTQGMASPKPCGERGDTLMLCLPLVFVGPT